jgi:hypothetical protein
MNQTAGEPPSDVQLPSFTLQPLPMLWQWWPPSQALQRQEQAPALATSGARMTGHLLRVADPGTSNPASGAEIRSDIKHMPTSQ